MRELTIIQGYYINRAPEVWKVEMGQDYLCEHHEYIVGVLTSFFLPDGRQGETGHAACLAGGCFTRVNLWHAVDGSNLAHVYIPKPADSRCPAKPTIFRFWEIKK